jgi:hypothetical protein
MFHIYVDVPKEKSGCASAFSVSKMLEKTLRVRFATTKRREN